MFGRLMESAAVYRLSSSYRMLGRLSDSVAVYRLSEGLSESAAPTPLPRFVRRFVKGWSGWEPVHMMYGVFEQVRLYTA